MGDAMDPSGTLTDKRDQEPADAVEISEKSLGNQETRCRMGYLHLAFVADKEAVEERAPTGGILIGRRAGAPLRPPRWRE